MNNIYLISCVKSKQQAAPSCRAEDMYISPLYRASLSYAINRVENKAEQIYILSAKYGLLPQDAIEQIVCRALATRLFRPEMLPALQQRYEKFLSAQNTQGQQKREAITRRLQEVQRGIDNVVEVVVKTGSTALTERLSALEKEQQELQAELEDLQRVEIEQRVDFKQLTALFGEAKRLLETGSLQCRKKLIEQYVEVVEVFPDRIHIVLRLNDMFHMDEWVSLENKKDARKKS